MGRALVSTQCQTFCPQVIKELEQQAIAIDYAANKVDINRAILQNKYDFIVICAEQAQTALDEIKWLKQNLAVPLPTHILAFSKGISREQQRQALQFGVNEFHDITGNISFKQFAKGNFKTVQPSRILLVEDSHAIAAMLIDILQQNAHQVVHFTTAKSAHDALLKESFDLLVTDLLLEGNKTGQDLIGFLQRRNLLEQIPTLVITGFDEPSVIVNLLDIGVVDVATKPIIPEEFLLRVEMVLKTKSYQHQLEQQSAQLLELSLTDNLTGAFNRRFMEDAIAQRINDLQRRQEPFSVLMIDADDFKQINDSQGHLAGDMALRQLTATVQTMIRNIDSFCRFGGEEFVLILADCDRQDAEHKAEEIRQEIAETSDFTISIGLVVLTEDINLVTLEYILNKVDSAVYKAKEQGKNRVYLTQ